MNITRESVEKHVDRMRDLDCDSNHDFASLAIETAIGVLQHVRDSEYDKHEKAPYLDDAIKHLKSELEKL